MRRSRAVLGSAAFFVVAPGTVVGVIPWLITGWRFQSPLPGWALPRVIGILLMGAGLAALAHAFTEFARAGGTPAPVAPTTHLVVSGFHRYVRNPMYVGLLIIVIGQSLLFGQFSLLIYAAAGWAITGAFVRWYEEPTLARQFGAEYDEYRRAVPAWRPRIHPWHPENSGTIPHQEGTWHSRTHPNQTY